MSEKKKQRGNAKFQLLAAQSDALGENRDCAVIAVSIAARVDYKTAHEALALYGRRPRMGTRFDSMTLPALEYLGLEVRKVADVKQPNGSAYTPKTISNKLKKGHYLCRVRGHVFAVVNGVVCDWSEQTKKRVNQIYRITKKRKG